MLVTHRSSTDRKGNDTGGVSFEDYTRGNF
jgi:hypothetical protein